MLCQDAQVVPTSLRCVTCGGVGRRRRAQQSREPPRRRLTTGDLFAGGGDIGCGGAPFCDRRLRSSDVLLALGCLGRLATPASSDEVFSLRRGQRRRRLDDVRVDLSREAEREVPREAELPRGELRIPLATDALTDTSLGESAATRRKPAAATVPWATWAPRATVGPWWATARRCKWC
jgi:hypothetical protein